MYFLSSGVKGLNNMAQWVEKSTSDDCSSETSMLIPNVFTGVDVHPSIPVPSKELGCHKRLGSSPAAWQLAVDNAWVFGLVDIGEVASTAWKVWGEVVSGAGYDNVASANGGQSCNTATFIHSLIQYSIILSWIRLRVWAVVSSERGVGGYDPHPGLTQFSLIVAKLNATRTWLGLLYLG